MITYKFSVVIEKDRDGYFAFCPELQGCYTQGDRIGEYQRRYKASYIEDKIESGEDIPQSDSVSFTLMEVSNS